MMTIRIMTDANIDNRDGDGNPRRRICKFYEQYLYSLLPAIYQEYDSKKKIMYFKNF